MTLGSLVGLVSALSLVLGAVLVLARLVPRLLPGLGAAARGDDPVLSVVARTGLGPKQSLAVVEADGRRALVGFGEGGVRLLMDLDPPDDDPGDVDAAPVAPAASDPAEGEGVVVPLPAPEPSLVRRAVGYGAAVAWRSAVGPLRRVGAWALLAGALAVAAAPAAASPPAAPGGTASDLVVEAGAQVPAPGRPGSAPRRGQSPAPGATASAGSGAGEAGTAPGDAASLLRARLPELGLSVDTGDGEDGLRLSGPVGVVVFMGFLTLLPTLLLLVTGFTRILVVLHLLKQAIGTQTAPPGHLLAALALLLTAFVMGPTLAEVNRTAVDPWVRGEMDEAQMIATASVPFRGFMLANVREQDLATFVNLSGGEPPETVDDIPLVVLATAFVTSELRAAFQMGFALFIPFVVIDLVVASVLMSMGMFMLPPVMVSLPFKLLLFVLVDGWSLVLESLVRSF